MSEISLKSRAEIDVPTPEPTEDGFGVLVVMRAELASFAGVLGHDFILFVPMILCVVNIRII